MEEKPMTVRQVAEQFGVNEDTVRRWLRLGKLKGRNLGGRGGYRIMPSEVRRFMEEGGGGDPER